MTRAVEEGDDVEIGPGHGALREMRLEEFEDLVDGDDVDGTHRLVTEDFSGTETGYKGFAGEVSTGKTAVDADGVSSVTVARKIDEDELDDLIPDDSADPPKESTEIDADVTGQLTADGQTLDSPALESKHWNPDKYWERSLNNELDDLEQKLITQAMAFDRPLVVVTTERFDEVYGDRLDEVLENVRNDPRVSSDQTVVQTTYDELAQAN